MSEQYVAAIDQGTTSTRCMIFNHEGRVVAVDQQEHEQIFPQAGWVEHNANEIWDNTRAVTAAALAKADLTDGRHRRGRHHQPARDRGGLGQTTGEPVYNAIVWQDTRTDAICQRARRPRRRRRAVQGQGRACRWPPTSPGPKVALDPRQRRRRPGEGRGRRPGVRQHGHLGALEHDRRRRRRPARHRPDQRLAAPC